MKILPLFKNLDDLQSALQDSNGPFVGLDQEKQQRIICIFLKLSEYAPQEFPYLVNNDPKAFEKLLLNPGSIEGSKEEQSNLNNWAEDVKVDTIQIQKNLEELD